MIEREQLFHEKVFDECAPKIIFCSWHFKVLNNFKDV